MSEHDRLDCDGIHHEHHHAQLRSLTEENERLQEKHADLVEIMNDQALKLSTQAEELERREQVVTAARELLWAFEHTYDDPGPGSRIPTLRRAIERLQPPTQQGESKP